MTNAVTKRESSELKQVQENVKQFGLLLSVGNTAYYQASKLYADDVQKDANRHRLYSQAFPNITKGFWDRIMLVGTDQMNPQLLLSSGPASAALRKQPRAVQDKVLVEELEVIREEGGTTREPLHKLTHKQTKMVFGPKGVRSPEAQKAWLESQKLLESGVAAVAKTKKAKQQKKPANADSTFMLDSSGNLVCLTSGDRLSLKDLTHMLCKAQLLTKLLQYVVDK